MINQINIREKNFHNKLQSKNKGRFENIFYKAIYNSSEDFFSYLEDNAIETSGLHVQAGLRFKVLVLDTHLNLRYNIAENVYDGSAGFAQVMFKMGFAF